MPIAVVFLLFGLFAASAAPTSAATVVLEAVGDATLIEDPDGAYANGSGPYFFAGRTGQFDNGIRRGLIRFDLAAALPHDALIKEVTLHLYAQTNNPLPAEMRLHRVLAAWNEGRTSASGGGGASAAPGDVTWLHRFRETALWSWPGGQFAARPSASTRVGGSGSYEWGARSPLVDDVQWWLLAPRSNFGWILLGDEVMQQSAKSFASREHPLAAQRPRLTIRYVLPDEGRRD